jgi:hypothetical protein
MIESDKTRPNKDQERVRRERESTQRRRVERGRVCVLER